MLAGMAVRALLCVLSARTVTLEEAQRSAEANLPQVREAAANTRAGDARSEQARAPLLPQVKLDLLYERTTGNRVQKPGVTRFQQNSFTAFNWWDNGLTGSLLLWDFGQSLNRWKAAEARAKSLGDTERNVRLQAVLVARAAFFQARAAKALVDVARATLDNEQRHLVQIQGFVQAGQRPEIDLAQQRATVASRRVQLINTQNAYTLSRATLNEAMGITAGTDYDVADDMLGPVPGESGPVGPLIEEALQARPDVAALAQQIRGQELLVAAAKGGYFPTLSLVGGATDAGIFLFPTAPDDFNQTRGLAWNLFAGLRLTWPLFQGFLTRGQVREADATLDGLHAQSDSLVQQIWVAVQQAAAGVRDAKEALVSAEEAVTAAHERLRLAEGRYAAGVGSIIELDDAQVAFTNASAQKVGADYHLAAARAELAVALGMR
jgi:outer membrane protein